MTNKFMSGAPLLILLTIFGISYFYLLPYFDGSFLDYETTIQAGVVGFSYVEAFINELGAISEILSNFFTFVFKGLIDYTQFLLGYLQQLTSFVRQILGYLGEYVIEPVNSWWDNIKNWWNSLIFGDNYIPPIGLVLNYFKGFKL